MNKYEFPKGNRIPEKLIKKTSNFEEFANGAMQVSIVLKNGDIITKVLLSDSSVIIAIRGYKKIPFLTADIIDILQLEEDKNPNKRNEWDYFETS